MSHDRIELVRELRELGIDTVTAAYDGYGDSGQIEDPVFGSVSVPQALTVAVQDLFYDLLEERYGGWELDEGSYGEFTWSVKDDKILLAHNARIESYEEQTL